MKKQEKLNDYFRDEISKIISETIFSHGEIIVSIIKTKVSIDLKEAKVFVSVYPEERRAEAIEKLNQEKNEIQKILSQKVIKRRIPKLTFISDQTEKNAAEIEALFEQIKKESNE